VAEFDCPQTRFVPHTAFSRRRAPPKRVRVAPPLPHRVMSRLRIHLFGALEIHRGALQLRPFPTQKARDLFAFLVLHPTRSYARDVLIGVFWGDHPQADARKRLRMDLWRVRAALATEEEAAPLTAHGEELSFDRGAGHWLDVVEFEERVSAARAEGESIGPEGARLLGEAVELYRGDLLEGVYDDWCLLERERLRLSFLEALARLMRYHQERAEWEQAIRMGRRLLATDSLQEHIHRALIRCHRDQGNRPAAVRQYAECRALLRRELDVEPMEETTALFEELGHPLAVERPGRAEPARTLIDARRLLGRVDGTLTDLRAATLRLEQARGVLADEITLGSG
jgi:DNA-binding SARP family transcriptional activator